MANAFDILGINRSSTEAEIKAAFRQKAKECHPDTHPNDPNATARFAEISAAYDDLKDGKAKTYQDTPKPGSGFRHQRDPFSTGSFGDINLEDIMRQFHQTARRSRGKNDDIGVNYNISLEEAYEGKTFTVNLDRTRGHTAIEVKVPAGIESGTRLRVIGGGHDSDQTLPHGDLYCTISIVPSNDFHRRGLDLIVSKTVDFFTAILGGTITVRTIGGTMVDVTIPRLVQGGTNLRVSGHGMPAVGIPNKFGDMIIVLDVTMPKYLLPGQMTLIEQARALDPTFVPA